jgi:hypothetical protein
MPSAQPLDPLAIDFDRHHAFDHIEASRLPAVNVQARRGIT